jgi:hypothetical protein
LIASDTAETDSEVAEMSSWDQANRGEKLDLVWRKRKKISQITNDYLYLPFFLLIILCIQVSTSVEAMATVTLMAPQQPKKATKKMMQPTTTRKMGVLKNWSPRKSRY